MTNDSHSFLIAREVYEHVQKHDGVFSKQTLARLASEVLLLEYNLLKAETTLKWNSSLGLALASGYNMVSVGAPLVALSAGLAIDIAIFGGAATALVTTNPLFAVLGAGSLVFGLGAGIAEKGAVRNWLYAATALASFGAAMIAANNPEFIKHFSSLFPSSWDQTNQVAGANSDAASAKVQQIRELLDIRTKELATGGRGGQPMLSDGYAGNDIDGRNLRDVIIPDLQAKLIAAREEAARAGSASALANDVSTVRWLGRVTGAAYLGLFLASAQYVIATVVQRAPQMLREQKELAKVFAAKIENVRQLENSPARVEARIGLILSKFEELLTTKAAGDDKKLSTVRELFSDDSLAQMTVSGREIFSQTLAKPDPKRLTIAERLKGRRLEPANTDQPPKNLIAG